MTTGSSPSAGCCRWPRRVIGATQPDNATRNCAVNAPSVNEGLKAGIQRVRHANWQVYRADKVWLQMNREGIVVARCTVERLMRAMGLQGARRGRAVRTTTPDT